MQSREGGGNLGGHKRKDIRIFHHMQGGSENTVAKEVFGCLIWILLIIAFLGGEELGKSVFRKPASQLKKSVKTESLPITPNSPSPEPTKPDVIEAIEIPTVSRMWTSTDGRNFNGRITRFDPDNNAVDVETDEGKRFDDVALEKFSAADQAFLLGVPFNGTKGDTE